MQLPIAGFDATTVAPSTAFVPLPVGEYIAEITDSEMKKTKDGKGEYLQFEFTVLGGDFDNRKVWARLNLINDNKTAVEIAYRELSAICHATKVMQITDSAQLHGKPITLILGLEKNKETSEMTNRIKGYKEAGAGAPEAFETRAPAAVGVAATQAQPALAVAGAKQKMPWEK